MEWNTGSCGVPSASGKRLAPGSVKVSRLDLLFEKSDSVSVRLELTLRKVGLGGEKGGAMQWAKTPTEQGEQKTYIVITHHKK